MWHDSLFRWENCRLLAPGHTFRRLGQDMILSHRYAFDTLLLGSELDNTQNCESFQVQGLTFLTCLSSSLTWAITSQWWVTVGFFLTPNTWFFQQPSNSQHPTGHPLSIGLRHHIYGVSANATSWGIKTAQISMPTMCSQVIMFLNKWLKLKISTLPPCSKAQSNQWTNSGKFLLTVLRVTYRKILRNSEMEEIFRSWV